MSRRTRVVVAVVLAAVIAVGIGTSLLGGRDGSESTAELSALRADPIARYTPPGARLVRTTEQDAATELGIPRVVRYVRTFSVAADDADDAFNQTRRAARQAGWTFRDSPSTTDDALGRSTGTLAERAVLSDRRAGLSIIVSSAPGASSTAPRTLEISLSIA